MRLFVLLTEIYCLWGLNMFFIGCWTCSLWSHTLPSNWPDIEHLHSRLMLFTSDCFLFTFLFYFLKLLLDWNTWHSHRKRCLCARSSQGSSLSVLSINSGILGSSLLATHLHPRENLLSSECRLCWFHSRMQQVQSDPDQHRIQTLSTPPLRNDFNTTQACGLSALFVRS